MFLFLFLFLFLSLSLNLSVCFLLASTVTISKENHNLNYQHAFYWSLLCCVVSTFNVNLRTFHSPAGSPNSHGVHSGARTCKCVLFSTEREPRRTQQIRLLSFRFFTGPILPTPLALGLLMKEESLREPAMGVPIFPSFLCLTGK